MTCGLYTITSPSGGQYLGSALVIGRRWSRHRLDLKAGKHHSVPLQRACDKYGLENLTFSVLLICSPETILFYEQRAIDIIKPAYNIASIAGNCRGVKRSQEFKKKISEALRRRPPMSLETRAKIGARHKGKKLSKTQLESLAAARAAKPQTIEFRRQNAKHMHTPEAKAAKALAMIGHVTTSKTRIKISTSLKGRKHSPGRIEAIMRGKTLAALHTIEWIMMW